MSLSPLSRKAVALMTAFAMVLSSTPIEAIAEEILGEAAPIEESAPESLDELVTALDEDTQEQEIVVVEEEPSEEEAIETAAEAEDEIVKEETADEESATVESTEVLAQSDGSEAMPPLTPIANDELIAQATNYEALASQADDRVTYLSGADHDTIVYSTVYMKPLNSGIFNHWYHEFKIENPYKMGLNITVEFAPDGYSDTLLISCQDENKNDLGGAPYLLDYDKYRGYFEATVPAGTTTITVYYDNEYRTDVSTFVKVGYSIAKSYSVADAKIAKVADQNYTGKAIKPSPKVTTLYSEMVGMTTKDDQTQTLKKGTDYTVSYKNNVEIGTASLTIKGKGAYVGTKTVKFKIVPKTFPDVKKGSWYYDVVMKASMLGLIEGYSDGTFGPDDNITRGQVAVILWRMANKPKASSKAKKFSDVKQGAYYYDAVRWASGVGVVSGYGNTGKFGPNDNVTREQLAVMLSNYASKIGHKKVTGSAANYSSMKDASKVSAFARQAVGWCFKNRILSGANGNIMPQGNATRAQAAKMLVMLQDML